MSTNRALLAGVIAGASLLIAAAALAQSSIVDIQVSYPDPVVASPGDTVEVEVSVVGVEGWQACEISTETQSEAACEEFQADFFCDDGMWDPLTDHCALSLCSCVSSTQNEVVFAPPLSIHTIEGSPDCDVIPSGWEGLFTLTSDDGGERLQADLPGDFSHGGLQFTTDSHTQFSAKLYRCRVDIADDAAVGIHSLPCASPSSTDPARQPNTTGCVNGSIEVVPQATPTATSVPTATSTPRQDDDDGGCAVVTPAGAGSAWWLAIPALALLWRRRRPC